MNRPVPFIPIGALNANPPADWTAARTLTAPAGANKLMIQCFTRSIRYRLDGVAPTNSVGFQLLAGDPPLVIDLRPSLSSSAPRTVKVIEEGATAVVMYQWGC